MDSFILVIKIKFLLWVSGRENNIVVMCFCDITQIRRGSRNQWTENERSSWMSILTSQCMRAGSFRSPSCEFSSYHLPTFLRPGTQKELSASAGPQVPCLQEVACSNLPVAKLLSCTKYRAPGFRVPWTLHTSAKEALECPWISKALPALELHTFAFTLTTQMQAMHFETFACALL